MRFWTQVQSASGGWTDVLGSDYDACVQFAKWYIKQGSNARVVSRVDTVVEFA